MKNFNRKIELNLFNFTPYVLQFYSNASVVTTLWFPFIIEKSSSYQFKGSQWAIGSQNIGIGPWGRLNNNIFSWYSASSALNQWNENTILYFYIAFENTSG